MRATRAVVGKLTADTAPLPARVAALAAELGIADRLVLSRSPGVFSFCFGTRRPRICVSLGLVEALTPGELKAVLVHERHHMTEHDPFKTAAAAVMAAVAFPLPLAWALRRAYLVARELDADRAAMAEAGRIALAGAIHKVATHPQAVHLHTAAAVGSFGAGGARLNQVIRPDARCYPRIGTDVKLASLGTLALFALGVLGPLGHISASWPAAPALTPSPMAPMVCQTLWGQCSSDMDSATCCISPMVNPPWFDRSTYVTDPSQAR
jgi:beta-lactamase regulating signal transducer with metallopeptidase domain